MPDWPYTQKKKQADSSTCLFLVGELGLADLVTPKNDIQCPFHLSKQTLIRSRRTTLKVCNDSRRAVAFLSKVLLCHGAALVVLRLGACFGNGLSDDGADGLGLHNVVTAVDLGETLTLGGSTL